MGAAVGGARRDLGARDGTRTRRRWWGLAFTAPAVAFFGLFFLYPLVDAGYLSLTDYDFFNPPRFVGLANYAGLFHDPIFVHSVETTAIYVAGSTVPVAVLALGLALVLQRKGPLSAGIAIAYFIPAVMSDVVVAIVWKLVLNDFGPVNDTFAHVGLGNLGWTSSPALVPWTVVWITVWQWTGLTAVIYMAALRSIPRNLYDAARVDGASAWNAFRDITLPLLRPTIFLVIAASLITGAQSFGYQYVISNSTGGPAYATNVLPLEIYNTAFQQGNPGRAAAMSMVLLVILLGVLAVLMAVFRKDAELTPDL